MSKFFLTNAKEMFDSVSAEIEKGIFKKSFVYSTAELFVVTTSKLDVQNCNYYADADDFVFATGTFIFQGEINLKNLFAEKQESVESLRKNAVGHYCACCKSGTHVKLFGPAYAAYDIYYYNANGCYLISNDLYTMSKVLKGELTINKLNLVEECIHTILGNETVYDEIKRLDGNEYISIDRNSFALKQLPYNKSLYIGDNIEAVKGMASFLKERAEKVNKVFGNPSICMTAGLDARTSLATYISAGAKPNLYYGVGNSFLTNTQQKDLEIDSLFEKEYGLKLNVDQWKSPEKINQDWPEVINKYGFYAYIYGGANAIFDFFRKIEGPLVTFGYGGELYRNLDWIENSEKESFSIDDFIEEYYVTGDSLRMVENVVGFREHLRTKLLWVCKKYDLNPDRIPNEANVFFLQEYRKTADTHLLNFVNQSKYCSLLLMENECLKYGMQSVESLKKSKFMLSVINQLYPKVLDVPVFSHMTLRSYNRVKGILETPLRKKPVLLKRIIKKAVPKRLLDCVKSVKYKKNNASLINQIETIKRDVILVDKNMVLNGMHDFRDTIKTLIFHSIVGLRESQTNRV